MIAAGGTAGHVVPALAVADALRERGAEVTFVGGERAEAELVPAAGYRFERLKVAGIDRRNPVRAARAVGLAVLASARAPALLRRLRPDVVLGGGGYVAGPVGLGARILGIPLALSEADSHLGLTNRLLAPAAERVFLAFPRAGRPDEDGRYRVVGRPIPRSTLGADREQARARFGIPAEATCLLVFGGSLGARSLNEAAIEAFAERSARRRRRSAAARFSTPAAGATTRRFRRGSRPPEARTTTACTRTSSPSPTPSRPPTWPRPARAARSSSSPRRGCRRCSCPIPTPPPTTRAATLRGWPRGAPRRWSADHELDADRLSGEVGALLANPGRIAGDEPLGACSGPAGRRGADRRRASSPWRLPEGRETPLLARSEQARSSSYGWTRGAGGNSRACAPAPPVRRRD